IFRSIQKIMLTDRLYRMYAPDPRSMKRIPFLELQTEQSRVRFLSEPPGEGSRLGILPALSREKWANALDTLSKAVRDEPFFLTAEQGEAEFRKLAERICREESSAGDRVRSVSLKSRKVEYGEFQGDIVWDEPDTEDSFECR